MNKRSIISAGILCLGLPLLGQNSKDSIRTIEAVVLSGNTFVQRVSDVPLPIHSVEKKQIKQVGSLRLNDILMEQTGLVITHNHGTGVQIQGMGTEYTLILVNGMPLLGRTAGTLDLSRITVNDIKRIEILKGPSSSLYGSDALAGVINIITEDAETTKGSLNLRAGTNTTIDFGGDFSIVKNNFSAHFSANRYSSEGYGFNNNEFAQVVNPFQTYTYSSKLKYKLSPKWELALFSRFYDETIDTKTLYQKEKLAGFAKTLDYNISPEITWKPTERLTSVVRWYWSDFKNDTNLKFLETKKTFDETFYREQYKRVENFTEIKWHPKLQTTLGAGAIFQGVEASRYSNKKEMHQLYGLAQANYKATDRWQILAGVRYDYNNVFGAQWNPKLATDFKFTEALTLRASVGRGFKAPDFRQLYLNFTNNLVGYSVVGTQEVEAMVEEMWQQGSISQIFMNPHQMSNLKAESSWAFNMGVDFKAFGCFKFGVNAFRNNIENLINVAAVARKSNGQNIFSYQNLNQIYTQGLETELAWKFLQNFNFSLGYQYLEAKDREVLDKIENGTIKSGENDQGETIKIRKHNYFGIIGRSKHSFNSKIFYQDKSGFFANLRAIYRGKYGFADLDGNGIINNSKELAPGYFLLNFSTGKTFASKYTFQMGIDNVLGHTNPQYNPEFFGRLWWASTNFSF
ncbi:TonB-dependent receptor plug domain-containing protein [Riemerella anatipestifer]|uniref:TonB-dependent receptor plug domain-containing protein n=1 Tax=Riemerella anatipestifer TaxID=34085 RepID=UPI0021F88A7E|nr:TonB-dependent receptor [Riemerella anatipestifer]MCW0517524.1 TonB-dependent receptor [Riemerella anatipestifer]